MIESRKPTCAGPQVSSDHCPQEWSIAEKCDLLIKLIRGISPPPPNHLWLINRLAEIRLFSQTDPYAARSEFEGMIRDLLERPDGAGGFVLTAERHREYLD